MTPWEKREVLHHCGRCHVLFKHDAGGELSAADICVSCFERCYIIGMRKSCMFPIPHWEWFGLPEST